MYSITDVVQILNAQIPHFNLVSLGVSVRSPTLVIALVRTPVCVREQRSRITPLVVKLVELVRFFSFFLPLDFCTFRNPRLLFT